MVSIHFLSVYQESSEKGLYFLSLRTKWLDVSSYFSRHKHHISNSITKQREGHFLSFCHKELKVMLWLQWNDM